MNQRGKNGRAIGSVSESFGGMRIHFRDARVGTSDLEQRSSGSSEGRPPLLLLLGTFLHPRDVTPLSASLAARCYPLPLLGSGNSLPVFTSRAVDPTGPR
jgi:hypothetical protein